MADKTRVLQLADIGGLLMLSLVPGLWYTFQYAVPREAIVPYFRIGSLLFLGCIALVLAVRLRTVDARAPGPPAWAGIGATALMLGLTTFAFSKEIAAAFGVHFLAFWLLLTAPAVIVLAVRGGPAACFLQAILGLVGLGALALTQPIDVVAANMLPITQAACENLLHGANPYATTYPSVATLHFYYLPGGFIPYCALQAAGIDIRWLNLAGYAAVAGCAAAAMPKAGRWPGFAAGALPLLVSPMTMQMLVHGHVWVYWVLFAAAYLALLGARVLWAAALLAAAVGARQLGVLMAVPLAGYLLAGGRRDILQGAAIGGLVLCLMLLPAWLAVDDFVGYFYTSIASESVAHNVHGINPHDQISLAALLPVGTGKALLQGLQVAVLLAGMLASLFLAWRDRPALSLSTAGVTMLLAVGLNPFLNRYFYMEGLLLLAMTLAGQPRCRQHLADRSP